ncbi:ABC transporter substrate-binding protein [uncultured Maritalea sp.]|uniref:ABC transporter substrate-binding protein n=1 Tax=uncultured Maritalea sp. TaxID=757249 RepID=UPI00261E4DF4|nr:ABC transporter substrate-binding protein [uncultured Maritalea sp.]
MLKTLAKNLAVISLASSAILAGTAYAEDVNPADWPSVVKAANGQEVYFNAWGGAPNINAYIAWVGERVKAEYGVTLNHVKLDDTANSVNRVLTEKAAGRNQGGSVDLIWINGENFASMKRQGLLIEQNWSEQLPNYKYADVAGKPTLTYDFTVPVDGQESPWGMAQLTFYYDSAWLETPPTSLEALAKWVEENPGRFTYASPPNFIGTTFLKQVLYGTIADQSLLRAPVVEDDFDEVTAPLWAYLDRLKPNLWRSGEVYAADTTQLKNLLADGEIGIAMTFNPGEASSAINAQELPQTVRSFVLDYGSMGNSHFVTIPYNANAKAGAMVVANFMLSAQAQARKADENIWGDPTVLDVNSLPAEGKALFDALTRGPATLAADEFGATLLEPDASWAVRLEEEWAKRHVRSN